MVKNRCLQRGIIREFSEIKEFREVVVLCEIALPYIP